MRTLLTRGQGPASGLLLAAAVWAMGVQASQAQVTVTPDTAPPALINPQTLLVDGGPPSFGDKFDPHVSGNLIAYTSDTVIKYFRVGVDSSPQEVPPEATYQDLLPNVFGTRIVFSRTLGDRIAIMIFDTAQPAGPTNPFEVDPQPTQRFSAALGGSTLAFIDSDLGAGGELLVYDLATAGLVRLTNDTEFDVTPRVSPDGSVIVWQHCPASYTLCDIWKAVKSGASWTVAPISTDPSNEEIPDTNGTLTVYDSDRPSGAGDIFYRDAVGTEHQLLLPGVQINAHIEGDFVVFESRNGIGNPGDIELYQISTNRLWNLTNSAVNDELDDVTVLANGDVLVVYDSNEYGASNRAVHAFIATVPSLSDNVPPTITIDSPVSGAIYLLNGALTAQYSCADSGSGVASCTGPVPSGSAAGTAAVGPQTFTVNASDVAGNAASKSVNYTVGYKVCVLYDSTKAKKSGSTYPIQIGLCDDAGANVSSSSITVHAVGVTMLSTNAPGTLDDAGNSNPDSDFRYDATAGAYVFNLKTTGFATGTYTINFTAGADPVVHTAPFQIK